MSAWRRSSRVSLFRAPRTCANWTGLAVRATGIVSPPCISPAADVPGVRSTKKLPSRKIRGRIFAVASS
jgi:hypothetical protein